MFYDDGVTEIGNRSLRPEVTNSYEVDLDHTFAKRLRTSASLYRSRLADLIEQMFTPSGLLQYVNADRVRSEGVSLELFLQLPAGIDLESSLEVQRSVFDSGAVLPNSPGQVGKLGLAIPVWRDRLSLRVGMQALGQRGTYGGATIPWVILPEAVVTTKPLAAGLQLSAGVKNLSNSFYRDPAGLTPTVDSVIGAGRTFYLNVTWRSAERDNHLGSKHRSGSPEVR